MWHVLFRALISTLCIDTYLLSDAEVQDQEKCMVNYCLLAISLVERKTWQVQPQLHSWNGKYCIRQEDKTHDARCENSIAVLCLEISHTLTLQHESPAVWLYSSP